jgi:signal transduction histidine kinase
MRAALMNRILSLIFPDSTKLNLSTRAARQRQTLHVMLAYCGLGSLFTLIFMVILNRSAAWKNGSVGLFGMQERVRLLGGRMEIISSSGAGMRVLATLPC